MSDPTSPTPVKPGWQTSEFWLCLLALVLAQLLPALDGSEPWTKLAGIALGVLAALGYTASRFGVKKAASAAGALLLAVLLLPGCGGTSPVLRQALGKLEASESHRNEREAVLRQLLANSWRENAEHEAEGALAKAGQLTPDAAMAVLRKALGQMDRAQKVLRGYEAEAIASTQSSSRLRAAIAGALRELEERSAATEQLSDALEQAAGTVGQIQAQRAAAKAADTETRRLEAERAAKEED